MWENQHFIQDIRIALLMHKTDK